MDEKGVVDFLWNKVGTDQNLHSLDPRVVQDLLNWEAFVGVEFQEVDYEIFERLCYFIAQVVWGFKHFFFDLIDTVSLERCTPMDHFIQKHP